MTDLKCQHLPPPRLSYIADHFDARRRQKLGERQLWCPVCKRWVWGEFWEEGVMRPLDPSPNQICAARFLRTLADHIETREGLKAYVIQTRGVVLVNPPIDLYGTDPLPETKEYAYDGTGEITIRWYDPEARTG